MFFFYIILLASILLLPLASNLGRISSNGNGPKQLQKISDEGRLVITESVPLEYIHARYNHNHSVYT